MPTRGDGVAAGPAGLAVAITDSVYRRACPLDRLVPDGAYHTFVTYDRRLVTVELFTGQLVLRDPKDIEHYQALFDFFAGRALWAEQARTLLQAVAEEFRSRK